MRAAIAASGSARASSASASAGISAISRAIAVCGSAMAAGAVADRQPQVPAVALQSLGGLALGRAEAEQDGDLHVAVAALQQSRGVGFGAADDAAHHGGGAAAQFHV